MEATIQQWTATAMILLAVGGVAAEELPELPVGCLSGEQPQCFTAADITGAVVGTFLATLALLALGYGLYRMYWRGRRGRHLVLVTDPEGGVVDDYAFDNPCFRDGTPIGRVSYEKEPVKSDQKNRWSAWSPLGALVGNRNEKRRALDDSFAGEPQVNVVSLRSHDFTGLGFNVCGNMRDGIFVKDVLHRGPASESGRISPGDRIDSIRISFRHMVFEDALTILSYASPYEVQLEVENPLPSSRPSTLIRTKRSSVEPADRICHPFYRSQSIADLAQMSKSSLLRVADKTPRSKHDSWDASDYPTLKLSPTPAKETVSLEKTAATPIPATVAIVKPERAKRPLPKTSSPDLPTEAVNKDVKAEQVSKHQKFGVRVLPDPKAVPNLKSISDAVRKQNSQEDLNKATPSTSEDKIIKKPDIVHAERQENERNSIVEQAGSIQPSRPISVEKVVLAQAKSDDVVDAGRTVANSFYDERGIDVGPVEEAENRRKASLNAEQAVKDEIKNKKSSEPTAGIDGHAHNVKLLLTKGLQNLKEKLNHHDKKKVSPEPEVSSSIPSPTDVAEQTVKNKSEISGNIDDQAEVKIDMKSEPEKVQDKTEVIVANDPDADKSYEGKIPTEISEAMQRAGMAARNKRKSLGSIAQDIQLNENTGNTTEVPGTQHATVMLTDPAMSANVPPVKYRVRLPESLSEDSSGDDIAATTSGSNDNDSLGQALKKSNKRKAPGPPAQEKNGNPSDIVQVVAVNLKNKGNQEMSLDPTDATSEMIVTPHEIQIDENIQTMDVHLGDTLPTFAKMQLQQNNPTNNEITNITVESSSALQPNSSVDMQQNPTQEDLKIIVDNPTSLKHSNSDSDSEGETSSSSAQRPKKGGTTIELNSSHITIHHSPSSDTVTLELETDSTRKAASMGDLSRLETEQPISVLERAVSLDLADGSAPHSSKKRKAPLPPPGEDHLAAAQDGDDTALYRKEPRLDNALDTFQRRRLKKSSDWGTMEDAMQQGSPPLSLRKSLTSPTNIHIGLLDNEQPTSLTISVGEDDSEVFIESLPMHSSEVQATSVPVASARYFDSPGKSIFKPDYDTSLSLTDTEGNGRVNIESSANGMDIIASQRTVLRITPEPMIVDAIPSQVTVDQVLSSTSNDTMDSEPRSSTPETEVAGSRLLSFIQAEYRNNDIDVEPDTSETFTSQRGESHTIVSSTPIARREVPYRQHIETIQSPQITSSEGVNNINIVSSSTHKSPSEDVDNDTSNVSTIHSGMDSSVAEPSVSVTSTSEAFITAGSVVDSTTFVNNSDDDDCTWGQDSQPPDLPTSPVPVLPTTTSMTYITEIQVTSMNADKAATDTTILNGNDEVREPSSIPTETMENEVEVLETETHSPISQNGSYEQKRNNVTVTAIRSPTGNSRIPTRIGNDVTTTTFQTSPNSSSPERSQIPLRMSSDGLMPTFQSLPSIVNSELSHIPVLSSFQSNSSIGNSERSHIPTRIVSSGSQEPSPTGSNGISEKKNKPSRPPVPPRKSDSSMSSVIAVEVPNTNRSPGSPQSNSAGSSKGYSSPTSQGGAKKFISYSSLTPRPVSGEHGSRNSSFEQWVFLDDGQGHTTNGNSHNGQEMAGDNMAQHSTVVTLPVAMATRPTSVTHIVLDSKQSSGKRGSQ